jgi:hypothetical protein
MAKATEESWTDDGMWDTGNGAMLYRLKSPGHPLARKYEFTSYCGRDNDHTWYEAVGDAEKIKYQTSDAAEARARELNAATRLRKQLKDHNIKPCV